MAESIQRQATTSELAAFEAWSAQFNDRVAPDIQSAIASSEICSLVQQWGNRAGLPLTTWTPTDQTEIDRLIDYGNRLSRIRAGIYSGKYFLQFTNGDMGVAAPPTMPSDQYDPDAFPVEAFGVIPIVVWVIVGGAILVGSLWGASEILKGEANRIQAKNQAVIIQADKQIAATDPATRAAWKQFKQQNADILAQKAAQADRSGEGGLFGKLFGKTAATGLGIGIAVAIGLFLFGLAGNVSQKKKQ